jgi:hypothetical protein
MLPTISNDALNSLNDVSTEVQAALAERDEHHSVDEINSVLSRWLDLCVESLCNDAVYHCVSGDRTYAFGRQEFEMLLKQKVRLLERDAATAQEMKDQQSLAAERAA